MIQSRKFQDSSQNFRSQPDPALWKSRILPSSFSPHPLLPAPFLPHSVSLPVGYKNAWLCISTCVCRCREWRFMSGVFCHPSLLCSLRQDFPGVWSSLIPLLQVTSEMRGCSCPCLPSARVSEAPCHF